MFRAMIKPRFFATVPCLASPFVPTHPIFFLSRLLGLWFFLAFRRISLTRIKFRLVYSFSICCLRLVGSLIVPCPILFFGLQALIVMRGLRLLFYCFSFFEVQSLSGSATFGWIAFLAPALFAAIPFAQSICRFLQF